MQYVKMLLLAFQAIPIIAEIVRSIVTGSKYVFNVENMSAFLLQLGQVARIKELTPEFVGTIIPALKDFFENLSIMDLIGEIKGSLNRL